MAAEVLFLQFFLYVQMDRGERVGRGLRFVLFRRQRGSRSGCIDVGLILTSNLCAGGELGWRDGGWQ